MGVKICSEITQDAGFILTIFDIFFYYTMDLVIIYFMHSRAY